MTIIWTIIRGQGVDFYLHKIDTLASVVPAIVRIPIRLVIRYSIGSVESKVLISNLHESNTLASTVSADGIIFISIRGILAFVVRI